MTAAVMSPLEQVRRLTRILQSPPSEEGRLSILATALRDVLGAEVAVLAQRPDDAPQSFAHATVIPIVAGGKGLGNLVIGKELADDELAVAEIGAAVAGVELLKAEQEEAAKGTHDRAMAQLAASSLTYSEAQALVAVFTELTDDEGLLVTSRIADQVGMTRSTIVNALRKLESAAVIEARSLGMKGTHIRVLNPALRNEIWKLDR